MEKLGIRKIFLAFIILALWWMALVPIQVAVAQEKVIKIGHIYPITGAQTDYWVT